MEAQSGEHSAGFTIIETMIVLVIAAIILIIIFFVVPAAERASRNYQRKSAVAFIAAEMERYYGNYGHYPISCDTGCDDSVNFIDSLKGSIADRFQVKYADNGRYHEYPFTKGNFSITVVDSAMDEISIQPAHICNRQPGLVPGDVDYPIKSSSTTTDTDYRHYVVWTQLEKAPVVCVSSKY